MLNRELLVEVATGQQQRNISDVSIRGYLSKMHVLTRKLNEIEDLRFDALYFDDDGNPVYHSNAARNVIKLKLPMDIETGRLLFAALSIDGSLTRKRGRAAEMNRDVEVNLAPQHNQPEDRRNMAANISTVSSQTYQNYKSALKWWPYKAISREHDLTSTLCKTNCTRTKVVMKALIAFAVRDRIIASAFDINQDNNQAIFDHTMPLLMEEIYPDPHERPMDLNINTLSNRMQRNNRNHL